MSQAFAALTDSVYRQQRTLDQKTKELLLTTALAAVGAPGAAVDSHLKKALDAGATREEVVEALELLLLVSGGATFREAYQRFTRLEDPDRSR